MVNQEGVEEDVDDEGSHGCRDETLGSGSNFSDLDLNNFEKSENLPFFFL